LEIPSDRQEGPESKLQKADSKQISFDMFSAGKSVQKIAVERGMAVSTIEGHLAYFVSLGKLDLERLVTTEKAGAIIEYLVVHEDATPGDVRSALGENFGYGEIKLVRAFLQSRLLNQP